MLNLDIFFPKSEAYLFQIKSMNIWFSIRSAQVNTFGAIALCVNPTIFNIIR